MTDRRRKPSIDSAGTGTDRDAEDRRESVEGMPLQMNQKRDDPYFSLIEEVPLELSVEVGRTSKLVREIVDYTTGSIIELDKPAGEPVDIFVNGQLIARGEVVVIDENFGVRILEIIDKQ